MLCTTLLLLLNVLLLLAGYRLEDYVTFVPKPSASSEQHLAASPAEPDRRSQPIIPASNVTRASSVEPHNASFQATHPSAATAAVSGAQPESAATSTSGSESGTHPMRAAKRQLKVATAAKNAEAGAVAPDAANSPWSIKAAAAPQPLAQDNKVVPGASLPCSCCNAVRALPDIAFCIS